MRYVILFISILVALCFVILIVLMFSNAASKLFGMFNNGIWLHYVKRKNLSAINKENSGTVENNGILDKIDGALNNAGWKEYYSYLSAEIFIAFIILITAVFSMIIYAFTKNRSVAFFVAVALLFIPWVILYFAVGIRYKKTERQLMIFINLLENYSRTSDDLVDIIAKTEKYLGEPLNSAIRKFSWEAQHVGETEIAILHLKEKIPHRKFQEIIQNLNICRSHDTNYEEVIADIRISMQQYLKAKEEKNSIRQGTRGSILIMMIVGCFIIRLVNGFVQGGLYRLLRSNFIGLIILFYILAVAIVGLWQLLKIDRS